MKAIIFLLYTLLSWAQFILPFLVAVIVFHWFLQQHKEANVPKWKRRGELAGSFFTKLHADIVATRRALSARLYLRRKLHEGTPTFIPEDWR